MPAKPTMPLAFMLALGCSHQAPPPAGPEPATASATEASSAPSEAAAVPDAPPRQTLAQADRLYDSQLGATRGGQFEVDHQVAELQRAILLYVQFIERAEGQPDMAPALKKSRQRIIDAKETIGFLDPKASRGPEPPPERAP
jgi:hypothetical protein